jgi:hypothetical protein
MTFLTDLQNNPQSKFQLIPSAVAAPGSCVTCGTAEGPFIDFGFLAEFYGAVVFCILCAQDCGRAAGLVDLVEDKSVIELPNWIPSILNDYEADVNAAMAKLRNCFDVGSISVLPSVEDNGESEAESTESEFTNSEELGTFDSDSESSGVEGPTGVSSNSSDDELFRESGNNQS